MKIHPLVPVLSVLLAPGLAQAQSGAFTTLHAFSGTDGRGPSAALIQGDDGSFYGTTVGDTNKTVTTPDARTNGTVFRVAADGTVTTLHVFSGGTDGAHPAAPLVQRADGTIFGTTTGGFGGAGFTLFRMATDGSGFTTLLQGDPPPGVNNAAITLGRDGNLYGVSRNGGRLNDGTVFRFDLATNTATILHSFGGSGGDGEFPESPLVQGTDGNFYGAAPGGGKGRSGTIFRISPTGDNYATIHDFALNSSDGNGPTGLVLAPDGNFYGATRQGGDPRYAPAGTVFRIAPDGTFAKIFDLASLFGVAPSAPLDPRSPPIIGPDGALYGTGEQGGDTNTGYGGVYRLTLNGEYSSVVGFNGNNGAYPVGGLVLGRDGNFYGVTGGKIVEVDQSSGGDANGTIFRIAGPGGNPAKPAFFNGEAALGNGVFFLQFSSGNPFGYYSYLSDAHYVFHQDLGYEYVFDANDGRSGVYLYDFASNGFFYTSPGFPFPYLYDFSLNTVLYYYPDPNNPGRYNTNGTRFFFRFDTGQIFSK